MRVIDPILQEMDMESKSTRRVLERVPEDKLGWKPHAKSMTLGQLALHVATTPVGVARMAQMEALTDPDMKQPQPNSRKEILDAFDSGMAEARELIGGMSDAFAMGEWKFTMKGQTIMAMPRVALLRSILLNHWYHHRGQMSVYLRLLDLPVPSVYGPTADENPFAG